MVKNALILAGTVASFAIIFVSGAGKTDFGKDDPEAMITSEPPRVESPRAVSVEDEYFADDNGDEDRNFVFGEPVQYQEDNGARDTSFEQQRSPDSGLRAPLSPSTGNEQNKQIPGQPGSLAAPVDLGH